VYTSCRFRFIPVWKRQEFNGTDLVSCRFPQDPVSVLFDLGL
jgi:hypothetical protein